jgi:exosortase C (VPDSG-CTERM-specific)
MGHAEEIGFPLAQNRPRCTGSPFRSLWVAVTLVVLCFSGVLIDLVGHALKESLHSHIILVPFICGYLLWQLRPDLPGPVRGGGAFAGITCGIGLAALGAYAIVRQSHVAISHNDYLSMTVFSFCMFLYAAIGFCLGLPLLKAAAFPLGFLLVLVPLPDFVVSSLEIASQYASAEVYSWFMNLTGATYYREGRTFVLPNLVIVVAQECSGIRSSLVLFLTSLIAGNMFLRTGWKRWFLALAVFPLGILRNAFRIYFLSMASAHWNPDIIHSPLHHRGGPIFFALSLIPFFVLLIWLRKTDCSKLHTPSIRHV